jgi:nicotinate-nucleotide adenylyltransferase
MRVALFGGSFDPPHRGHVAIARAAADTFNLDRVLFTPTGRQPLKPSGAAASFRDRLQMVRALEPLDRRFAVSELDAPREDGRANYTVETLARLREGMPEAELFALAGADSFRDLPRWREPHRLLELAQWIVVSRPGFALETAAELALSREQQQRVLLVETVHEDVSATELRDRLRSNLDCAEWIPEGVLRYIRSAGLYVAH